MRVTKQRAAENRERVVEEAARLFRQKGFDGVGVAELMAAAGLTHGGFYNHFGSKDDVEAAALARVFERSVERIAAVAEVAGAEEAVVNKIGPGKGDDDMISWLDSTFDMDEVYQLRDGEITRKGDRLRS